MNKQQVIKKIGKANWGKFYKFMRGQTVGICKDGKSYDYYDCDVERFMRKLKDGSWKYDFWD